MEFAREPKRKDWASRLQVVLSENCQKLRRRIIPRDCAAPEENVMRLWMSYRTCRSNMCVEPSQNALPGLCFQDILCSADGIRQASSWTKRWLFTYNKVPWIETFLLEGRWLHFLNRYKIEYKSYLRHHFKDVVSTIILFCFVTIFCRDLDDCNARIKYLTKALYICLDEILRVLQHVQTIKLFHRTTFRSALINV